MATTTADSTASSGWVSGLAVFAGCMLIMIGLFQFFEGLAAIINDEFYVVGPHYTYNIDVTAWGWIHLIWGAVVCVAGFAVFSGHLWARIIGILVALGSAVTQFLYIPYYPLWAVLLVALNVACIWALATYKRQDAADYYA